MCCENEPKVSEDIRVIHDELEKADTWIFAAQEILRPENEEFEPDIKDIGNIEVVLSFAITNIKEAITLCQIYRASREDKVTKKDYNQYNTLGDHFKPFPIVVDGRTETILIKQPSPSPTDPEGKPVDFSFSEVRLREAKEALSDLEKKMEFLKANTNIQRVKLTPEELKLYKDV